MGQPLRRLGDQSVDLLADALRLPASWTADPVTRCTDDPVHRGPAADG
ncbi:hypothetical protein [Kitasatospora sp. NPDC097643]